MANKLSKKHPYAAIEWRVIDSAAYADLSFSARSLLTLITRQLSKDNNGHLQATHTYMRSFGFANERTLAKAIADLISHGFIYRTRSHGANKTWAKYAVTWLPVRKGTDLYLDCFQSCAWRNWPPGNKKSTPQKVQDDGIKKCSLTPDLPAKSAGTTPAKSTEYELMPCSSGIRGALAFDCEGAVDDETRSVRL